MGARPGPGRSAGQGATTVFNAANEVAVLAFLRFTRFGLIIRAGVENRSRGDPLSLPVT